MSESGSDGPSFDPRSWRAAKPGAAEPEPAKPAPSEPPPPQAADSPPTFDPKSWAQPRRRAAAARKSGSSAGLWLAGLVGVLAIAGAGIAFVALQPRHASPASPKLVAIAQPPAAPSPHPPTAPGEQKRSLTLAGADQLLAALTSAGVSGSDAQAAAEAAQARLGGKGGQLRVTLMLSPSPAGPVLTHLDARHDDGAGAVVTRQADGRYAAAAASTDLALKTTVVRGQMDVNSFYSSAVSAGVNDDLIPGFAQAFAYDFDFQREIKPGDVFEAVIQQQVDPSGATVGSGKLLYASLETQAKSKALYWYAAPGKSGGWFDANGRSIIRALMRTPVEGARISSPFGVRFHPVLGFMKMHNGTDFAAPVGTPIYAAGDGVVEFSGPKGPNGNFTKILHPNGWETLYLHQSMIEPYVVAGAHVHQSQQIGAVGATGVDSAGHSTVTGPHLHYELHIEGKPVDAMAISMGVGATLSAAEMAGFTAERNRIDAMRAAQGG
jgi:murein DD-endopeptidase MepM/ murein hydrolase activator NlpD